MASIFNIFSNLYDGASETLSSSESCLRYYIIDPLLQACNKYPKDRNNNVTFYPGEIELKAMWYFTSFIVYKYPSKCHYEF
ncbi:hypothetical protein BDB01DRAFT_796581 [Pilobolus umbonatus]|nr:hypothetical protein BDB01DRAFT_796581 [Pilobolus umbonatus]